MRHGLISGALHSGNTGPERPNIKGIVLLADEGWAWAIDSGTFAGKENTGTPFIGDWHLTPRSGHGPHFHVGRGSFRFGSARAIGRHEMGTWPVSSFKESAAPSSTRVFLSNPIFAKQ